MAEWINNHRKATRLFPLWSINIQTLNIYLNLFKSSNIQIYTSNSTENTDKLLFLFPLFSFFFFCVVVFSSSNKKRHDCSTAVSSMSRDAGLVISRLWVQTLH